MAPRPTGPFIVEAPEASIVKSIANAIGCWFLTNGHEEETDASTYLDDTTFDTGDDSNDVDEWFDAVDFDFKHEDSNNIAMTGDVDEQIQKLIKPEPRTKSAASPPPAAPSPQETPALANVQNETIGEDTALTTTWSSSTQLTEFREAASKIADDYLEQSGVKLYPAHRHPNIIRDYSAFAQGKRDSKKINVRQNRIEG